MPTDLPDEWFRPSHCDEPGDQGLDTPDEYSDEKRDTDATAQSQTSTGGAGRSSTSTGGSDHGTGSESLRPIDPEQTGRLSLGSPDDGWPSVVVGHAPSLRGSQRLARHRGVRIPLLVLGLVIALVLGLVLGSLAHRARSSGMTASRSTAVTSISVPASTAQPWGGATRVIAGTRADASCVAAPAMDESRREVRYPASNAVDGRLVTAWRCDGEAVGQRLTFTVPSGTRLVGVGMVNGYAKRADGMDLYSQYRRVLKVRWQLPGGAWFTQDLTDGNRTFQTVMITPHVVRGPITMTILSSSSPGMPGEPTRDAVLISEVRLLASS